MPLKTYIFNHETRRFEAADGESLDLQAYMSRTRAAFAEHLAGVPQRKGRRQEAVERSNGYGWTGSKRRGLNK
jgi:hypothetical protein